MTHINSNSSPIKVALITGAAHRLGAQTAKTLHALGWQIIIHYHHSQKKAEQLCQDLNHIRPLSCHILQANLDQHEDVLQLTQQAQSIYGHITALINNASRFYPTTIGSTTLADWDALFGSNLKAPFFLSQALAATLKEQQGAIINMVDIHAQKPLSQHTVYCMAKAGLAMLTESLAKELAPHVRVNGIAPGAILWPSESPPNPEQQANILNSIPLGQLGSPLDIAHTIAFLLNDAPYITGQIIAVDGGRRLS